MGVASNLVVPIVAEEGNNRITVVIIIVLCYDSNIISTLIVTVQYIALIVYNALDDRRQFLVQMTDEICKKQMVG